MSRPNGDQEVVVAICLDCRTFVYWTADESAVVTCGECEGPLVDIDFIVTARAPASYDRPQIREFYLRRWEAGKGRDWLGDHARIALPSD